MCPILRNQFRTITVACSPAGWAVRWGAYLVLPFRPILLGVAYLILPSQPVLLLAGQVVGERGQGAYLVLPLRPVLLLVGWLVGERGWGWGRGGAYLVLLAQPYILSRLISPAPSPCLIHPVVLSHHLLVVLHHPVAIVVGGVVGGAAPAIAVVVVQVGVEGTWAGAAGASGEGGGGGGH